MSFIEGKRLDGVFSTDWKDKPVILLSLIAVAKEMKRMHEMGVVHWDLKPSNVIIQDIDNELKATFIDFGLSRPRADLEGHAYLNEFIFIEI